MKSLRKNKIIRTCAAFLLCFTLAFSVLGLNNYSARADVTHVIRDYASLEDTDRFMIGGYYGGDAYTDAGIALLQGAGLDFTTMTGNYATDYCSWSTPSAKATAIYDKLHNAGLKVLLAGGRGTVPATTGKQGVTDPDSDGRPPYDYSQIVDTPGTYGIMAEQSFGLSYTDAVLGTELWDEPLYSELPAIELYVDRYEQAFPGKLFFVNLIATEGINYDTNGDSVVNVNDYINYVETYATNIADRLSGRKMMSTDPYPFNRANRDSSSYYYINPNYITTLATSAVAAKLHGADLSYYVQTMDCSQESHTYKNSRDVKGQADVSMQYNVAMAFGAKQIINFCYETANTADPFMSTAMLDNDGVPTARYTWVKNAADVAHYLGQTYMNFNWNGTIIARGTMKDRFTAANNRVTGGTSFDCYGDIGNSYYTSLVPYATSYNSNPTLRNNMSGNNLISAASSQTAFIGCFTDDAGYNGYMLASGDDAISNTATAMALQFDDSTEKVRIFKGTSYTDETLTNHTLNISLNAGEGAFVVPYKATEVEQVTLQVEGYVDEVIKVEHGGSFVLPDRLSGVNAQKILVGYIYNGALFPVGYEMPDITQSRTLTAKYLDLTMEFGASVRINSDNEHAIRWRAFLKKSEYTSLNAQFTVLGYGFTIVSTDKKGSMTIDISSENFVDTGEGYYQLAGVMTHVAEEELTVLFEARAFVKIRFSNGETKKIHARGNENLRSIAYVANAALNDTSGHYSEIQLERLRRLSVSYGYNDNLGSINDWLTQVDGDNIGSLDYWLRLIALNS